MVSDFARFIQAERPDIKGFSASNIWRMRQFYETYSDNEKLAPLVREISWTQNLQGVTELSEIVADIRALERETDGLLEEVLG